MLSHTKENKTDAMREGVYTHHLRVRYADTDQMGVVYHGRYFEWFEAARTEMMRRMGLAYRELEEAGLSLPVVEAHCRYSKPVTYDEWIGVETWLTEVTRLKIRLEYRISDDSASARIRGYTVHCFVNPQGRPVRAPREIFDFFRKHQRQGGLDA